MNTYMMNQPSMNKNINTNNLIESLKPMLFTMMMVNGKSSTMLETVWSILAISIIEFILSNGNSILQQILLFLQSRFKKNIESTLSIASDSSNMSEKKASITINLKLDDTSNKNSTVYAIIDLLTNFPKTKHVILKNNEYFINYNDPIEIETNIYAKLLESSETTQLVVDQKPTPEPSKQGQSQSEFIELYSYTLNMEELRGFLDRITKDYIIRISNKLGHDIYYFNEINISTPYLQNGKIDYSKLPDNIHFKMKPFYTNRKFSNLFGEEIDIIKKRVLFFKNNKKWYDDKGIPYTLGLLMGGIPGSGKTSTIKCLANELKRHIINIHLDNKITKTQLENLFFNEIVNVTQNGKTEQYHIPIDKRIYVLEDVDCQCEFILDREKEIDLVSKLKMKIDELTECNEKLMSMLEEPNKNRVITLNKNKGLENIHKSNDSLKITLSFLLNLLDGVLETPGRIIIMTSNYASKMDYALIRPGRFDIISDFGYCTPSMIIQVFNHHYDNTMNEEDVQRILAFTIHFISPAELGKVLFENFDNMNVALETIYKLYHKALLAKEPVLEPVLETIKESEPEPVKELEEPEDNKQIHEYEAYNPDLHQYEKNRSKQTEEYLLKPEGSSLSGIIAPMENKQTNYTFYAFK
jgi:hypothetical protein